MENQRRQSMPTSIDDLTDDLLELVLLRGSSHVCLVRAAATCRLWRRVIADAGFLRCIRHLHAPHLLGYLTTRLHQGNVTTDFVPTGATPPGSTTTISLSLDLVHQSSENLWLIDSRGGLLAFADNVCNGIVVVCDPRTSKCEEVGRPPLLEHNRRHWQFFLLDADADDETGISTPLMSCFRVLCAGLDADGRHAKVYMFAARDGRWSLLSSTADGDIVSALTVLSYSNHAHLFYLLGGTGGSLFWGVPWDVTVLALDEGTGEFSVLPLPEPVGSADEMQYNRRKLRAISGNARTVRLVRIVGDDLEVLTIVREGGACVVDGRVGLSQFAKIDEQTRWFSWNFLDTAPAAGPGSVVLSLDCKNMWMFSVETMKLERLSERISGVRVFPYELPWPPTIKACLL